MIRKFFPVLFGLLLCSASASATTYGPDSILQCPGSKSLVRSKNLASGNNAGRVAWSDGYLFQPFMPRQPIISRCDQGAYFWVTDAKVLGNLPQDPAKEAKAPKAWREAPYLKSLSPAEYLEALSQNAAKDAKQEGFLRKMAWWSANDAVRDSKEAKPPSPFASDAAARENLEALARLQNEKEPPGLLTKAEIYRELGHFDEALKLLKMKLPEEFHPAQKKIIAWAKNKDVLVRKLFDGKEEKK